MSFQALTIANAVKLPAPKKALLFVIANYTNDENKFWPSYQTLADDSGMSRRSVIDYMAGFEQMGLITKQRRVIEEDGKTRNTSNEYRFTAGAYLKRNGYVLTLNDKGFLVVEKAKRFDGVVQEIHQGGAGDSPPLVQEIHQGGAGDSPNTVIEPVNNNLSTTTAPEKFAIPSDWQPDQSTIDRLKMRGLSDQFISDYLAEFIPHWKASGKARAEWDSTFTRQAIEQWEQRAHRRTNQPAPQADDCPVAEIVKVWNRAMPNLRVNPDVVATNSDGARIRERWAAMHDKLRQPKFFHAVFKAMAESKSLMAASFDLNLGKACSPKIFDPIASKITARKTAA